MSVPTTVAFHGMAPREWIEAEVRARADKLDRYCGDIISCRVAVDLPHRHHKDGNRFSVRIDLTVPGEELAVTHGSNVHGSKQHLDEEEWVKKFDVEGMRKHPRLVIKEAFDVARRRLQDYTRLRRHAVKTHEKREQGAA